MKPHLAGTAYDVFGPQDLIRTVGEVSRAPDVFVAPRLVGRPKIRFIPDPVIVIEVVSDDRDLDYVTKRIEYERVATILHYIIVEQDEVGCVVGSREHGDLPVTPSPGKSPAPAGLERGNPISIPELGLALPLAAVYADLGMPP